MDSEDKQVTNRLKLLYFLLFCFKKYFLRILYQCLRLFIKTLQINMYYFRGTYIHTLTHTGIYIYISKQVVGVTQFNHIFFKKINLNTCFLWIILERNQKKEVKVKKGLLLFFSCFQKEQLQASFSGIVCNCSKQPQVIFFQNEYSFILTRTDKNQIFTNLYIAKLLNAHPYMEIFVVIEKRVLGVKIKKKTQVCQTQNPFKLQ